MGSLFVEPFDGTPCAFGVLVGVGPFPVFEVEGRFWKGFEGVFGLWLRWNQVILLLWFGFLRLWLLLFLRLLSRSGFRLVILLLRIFSGWGVCGNLLWPFDIPELGDLWLVEDSLDEADDRGILVEVVLVQDPPSCAKTDGGDMDVGDGQAFANKEGPGFEDFLESIERPLDAAEMIRMRLFDRKTCMRPRENGEENQARTGFEYGSLWAKIKYNKMTKIWTSVSAK